jgi:hypothetical protein
MRPNAGCRRAGNGRDPGMCRYAAEIGIMSRWRAPIVGFVPLAAGCRFLAAPRDARPHPPPKKFPRKLGRDGLRRCRLRPALPTTPARPGLERHSGCSEARDPARVRHAAERGMSTGWKRPRSRNVPLCGRNRENVALARAHCRFCAAGRWPPVLGCTAGCRHRTRTRAHRTGLQKSFRGNSVVTGFDAAAFGPPSRRRPPDRA